MSHVLAEALFQGSKQMFLALSEELAGQAHDAMWATGVRLDLDEDCIEPTRKLATTLLETTLMGLLGGEFCCKDHEVRMPAEILYPAVEVHVAKFRALWAESMAEYRRAA